MLQYSTGGYLSLNLSSLKFFFLHRFKRNVLEGTLEDLIDNFADADDTFVEKITAGNETASERSKRQASFPDTPDANQDSTK